MADTEGPDGIPGHFPQLSPRAPNSAGFLCSDAHVGFVPGDTHAGEVMVISPRLSLARPRDGASSMTSSTVFRRRRRVSSQR
jgi:hypothetical protein